MSMESIKTIDKKLLQNRINKYFDSFQEVDFEGRKFNLMPSKEDVPLVKKISYNPAKDVFEIIFYTRDTMNIKRRDQVEFLEDSEERLIGIRVYNLKQRALNTIDLQIVSTLDRVKSAKVNLGNNPSLKDIAEINIEERKIRFFKDFFESELKELVEA